jgi:hypothetical protein
MSYNLDHKNQIIEPIAAFHGWNDYHDFLKAIEESESFQETEVLKAYFNLESFDQRWFIHVPSNETWRLVEPDPPFAGVWEKV